MTGAESTRRDWLESAIERADAWGAIRQRIDPSGMAAPALLAERVLAFLPPADLPATLATVDDVRRVCEAAGLTEWQSHPASKLPVRWGTDKYPFVGVDQTDQVLVWLPTVAVVPVVVPLQWPTVALWHAIAAARSTT